MDNAEKTAQAAQRAQKKAARRATFIQEVAEAVVALQQKEKVRLNSLNSAHQGWA
jgi:hypothetical protein